MDQKPQDEGEKPAEQEVPAVVEADADTSVEAELPQVAPMQDAGDVAPQPEADRPAEEEPSQFAGYGLTEANETRGSGENVPQEVQWEASEYIHHEKGILWFVALGAITVVAAGIGVWLRAWTFLILLAAMVVALFVYAHRPPRTLKYHLAQGSLNIDGKEYKYEEFKAFGIQHDGAFYSVVLVPTKRFMPAVNIFFDQKDGEQIVDILGAHLPMQEMEPDMVDRLFKKLRF
jgi:hypothetical protein